MGKSIARGSKKTLVDQCYSDPDTRPLMLKKIGRVLRAEMKTMCSQKTASILRSGNYDDMKSFSWDQLINEMNLHAPVLMNILQSCTHTGKAHNKMAVIGVCAAVLLNIGVTR